MQTPSAEHIRLCDAIRPLGRVIVAFSGGIDSTVVLKAALEALGSGNVLAATGVSASLAARELEEVRELASLLGAKLELVQTDELANPSYAANPANRCYHCKSELYTRLGTLAAAGGFAHILSGNNADDCGDWRPGMTAAEHLSVRSPLIDARLGKAQIRQLAREMGLPNAEKPAMPCLASRVPYGTPINIESLQRIEQAEALLREEGFSICRVRHHGKLARIEVPLEDLPRLLAEPLRSRIIEGLRAIGYTYISADLQGFRSGSGNEAITSRPRVGS